MRRIALAFITLLSPLFIAAPVTLAYGGLLNQACNSSPTTSSSAVCKDYQAQKPGNNPVIETLAKATKVISLIAGFAAIIMIVVSGINMITSAGNSESVTSARKRLTGAVIGLALASFAWLLASFIIKEFL